ncbi:uncharacterized protein J4E88_010493 [Alternaria novae-zelandiae]|uniref:uncharacterized protein n=1 Tax=Alternaria novae-zelandiae TaxID=430562 RepID=UPI0020C535DA|nr:uncharacterized protein J4E88_010493 [Alternaria novae-zelandiae]KAI4666198.1 hypothetical protein J4E88_010493 [Alternaria novae-zelandiae]
MATLYGPLDEVLQDAVSSQARAEIVQRLWRGRRVQSPKIVHFAWDAYFGYYTRECNAALTDEGAHLCSRTHRSLLQVAHLLEDAADEGEIRERLRQTLKTQRTSADEKKMLDGSLKLATRIFAMISIGPLSSEISAKHSLPWDQGTFTDAVHEYFNQPPEIELDPNENVVSADLVCYNIERMSGIEVLWTDNLLDHLRLVEGDKKLCVFHHASFLRKMMAIESSIFPDGLIEETLDTLALLFPESDRKTKRWLSMKGRANSAQMPIDSTLAECGRYRPGHPSRRLERFQFWRDRLVLLGEAVEEATPTSKALLKALKDSKKGDHWLNSWIAIVAIGLTLFFGLVQSIEGAIQVYKAYHPQAEST